MEWDRNRSVMFDHCLCLLYRRAMEACMCAWTVSWALGVSMWTGTMPAPARGLTCTSPGFAKLRWIPQDRGPLLLPHWHPFQINVLHQNDLFSFPASKSQHPLTSYVILTEGRGCQLRIWTPAQEKAHQTGHRWARERVLMQPGNIQLSCFRSWPSSTSPLVSGASRYRRRFWCGAGSVWGGCKGGHFTWQTGSDIRGPNSHAWRCERAGEISCVLPGKRNLSVKVLSCLCGNIILYT